MTTVARADAGELQLCRPDEDAALDALLARLHHHVRVALAGRLDDVVPDGWEVSAGCRWLTGSTHEPVLHPDVVVHRTLDRAGHLPAPPVLCVDVAAGPRDRGAAQRYARLGVDHHWHLDTRSNELEVSVRVDDGYRRAETLPAPGHPTGPAWVDFGIAVVDLDLSLVGVG